MSIRRTPTYPPSQTRISVQDTYDAGTPQGTAQINEEFRRIQLFANAMAEKVENLDKKVPALEDKVYAPVTAGGGVAGAAPSGQSGYSGYSGQPGKDGDTEEDFSIEVQIDTLDLDAAVPDYKTAKVNFLNPIGTPPPEVITMQVKFSGDLVNDQVNWQNYTLRTDARWRADIEAYVDIDAQRIKDTISGWSGIGISGFSGYSGYSGYSGTDAQFSGTSGYSGQNGQSGYSGISGYSGTNGASGFSGYSGYSGIGTSGYSGVSGYSGMDGQSGHSGQSGVGIAGESGFSGATGYSGAGTASEDKGWTWYFTGTQSDILGYCYLDCHKIDDLDNTPPVERFAAGTGGWIYTDPDGNIRVDTPYTGWITPEDLPVAQLNHIGNWVANVILSHRASDATVTLYKRNIAGTETEITDFLCDYIDSTTYHYYEYHIEQKENCVHWEYKDRLVVKITPIADEFLIGGIDRNYFGRPEQTDYGLGNASGYEPSHIRMPIPEAWYGDGGGYTGITTVHTDAWGDSFLIGTAHQVDTLEWVDSSYPPENGNLNVPTYGKFYLESEAETTYPEGNPTLRTLIRHSGVVSSDALKVVLDAGYSRRGLTTLHNDEVVHDGLTITEADVIHNTIVMNWEDTIDQTSGTKLPVNIRFYHNVEEEAALTPQYNNGLWADGYRITTWASGELKASDIEGLGVSGYSGYSGYSGATGAGFSGYSGYSGYSGTNGTGTIGQSGFSGYSGYSGIGTSGYSGQNGQSGYSGFSGTGGIGTSGFSGQDGVSGYSGESGHSGFSGQDGQSGYSGYSGVGATGQSGYSGYSGTDGVGASYSGITTVHNVAGTRNLIGTEHQVDTLEWVDSVTPASYAGTIPCYGKFYLESEAEATYPEGDPTLRTLIHHSGEILIQDICDIIANYNTSGTMEEVDPFFFAWVGGSSIAAGSSSAAITYGIAIGDSSTSSTNSVAIGKNTESSGYSVAIGRGAEADNNGVAIGYYAAALNGGNGSVALGDGADTNSKTSAIALGGYSWCDREYEFSVTGDGVSPTKILRNQASWYGTTTDATQTELFLGGLRDLNETFRYTILGYSAVLFKIDVIAVADDGIQGAAYKIEGAIRCDENDNAVLIGTPTIFIIGEDDPAWSVLAEADTTNVALVVKVTGAANTHIKWHAAGYFTEVRL